MMQCIKLQYPKRERLQGKRTHLYKAKLDLHPAATDCGLPTPPALSTTQSPSSSLILFLLFLKVLLRSLTFSKIRLESQDTIHHYNQYYTQACEERLEEEPPRGNHICLLPHLIACHTPRTVTNDLEPPT